MDFSIMKLDEKIKRVSDRNVKRFETGNLEISAISLGRWGEIKVIKERESVKAEENLRKSENPKSLIKCLGRGQWEWSETSNPTHRYSWDLKLNANNSTII